jgi:hypothetical protein
MYSPQWPLKTSAWHRKAYQQIRDDISETVAVHSGTPTGFDSGLAVFIVGRIDSGGDQIVPPVS